jgi:hypothetical protein
VTATSSPALPAAATTRVLEHGEASSLPRPKRPFWRVVVVMLAVCVGLALAWFITMKVEDPRTLRHIAQLSLGLVYFSIFVFVADGSAQDVVHLVTAFKSTRKETVMSAPPPAVATPEAVVSQPESATPVPTGRGVDNPDAAR